MVPAGARERTNLCGSGARARIVASMLTARTVLVLALALAGAACKSDPPPKKRPGFQFAPASSATAKAALCTFGADQTCNDDSLISSIQGSCNQDGTCSCHPGFSINPSTGKCRQ